MRINQHIHTKMIGVAIIVLTLPLCPVWAFDSEGIDAMIGVVPSVGMLWSRHGGLGVTGDVTGTFLLANTSLQYSLLQDQEWSGGRMYGGLGVGMYVQIQIGFGNGGWNGRYRVGVPLKIKEHGSIKEFANGDPLLWLFTEVGPAWDVRLGAMLGVFLRDQDWP